jgi:glycosyltransferase involved in cell wall biosynthesis
VHVLLADTAEDFAAAVIHLLGNEALRLELSRRAREFVRERYDWSAILPLVEAAYEAAIAAHD